MLRSRMPEEIGQGQKYKVLPYTLRKFLVQQRAERVVVSEAATLSTDLCLDLLAVLWIHIGLERRPSFHSRAILACPQCKILQYKLVT